MAYRIRSGVGFGVVAIMLLLGCEHWFDFQTGRDGMALLAMLAGSIGSSMPIENSRIRT